MRKLTVAGWVSVVVVALLGVVAVVLVVVNVVLITTKSSIPDAGTVPITGNLSEYGFGEHKWLLVIDITENFGTVDQVDLKDKYHATMDIYEQGQVKETYDIGIEIKGRRDRIKLNYGIEYWVPDEDEASGYKDDDTIFPMFEEHDSKEEDYVLRGGFMEPTLTRDAFAARIGYANYQDLRGNASVNSVGYPAELVELIFKTSTGYTYEGVYLFMYDIGRRSIRGGLKDTGAEWSGKGKKLDCEDWTEGDDVATEVENVAIIMEYTVQDHKEVEADCGTLSMEENIQMEYPTCDFLQKYLMECEADNRSQYGTAYNRMAKYRSLPDHPDFDLIHMQSFVWHFVFEMIMLSDDFPFASQYLWVPPAIADDEGNRTMRAGPPYDYDGVFWRVLQQPKQSWTMGQPTSWNQPDKLELTNRHYYDKPPMELWTQLGTNRRFVEMLRTTGVAALETMQLWHHAILDKRKRDLSKGYWDRNNERWEPYGKAYISGGTRIDYWLHRSAVLTKKSMAEELAYIEDWTKQRVSMLELWLPQLTGYSVNDNFHTFGNAVRELIPMIVVSSVFVLCLILLIVAICLRSPWLVVREHAYAKVTKETQPLVKAAAVRLPQLFLS